MFRRYNQRGFDLLSVLVVIVMVFLSAYSLESTRWTEDLNLVTSLAMLGIILGVLCGASNFSRGQLAVFVVIYAIVLLFQFLVVLTSDVSSWIDSMFIYRERIVAVIQSLRANSPVEDNILFISGMGIFYLVTALWMGISLVKRKYAWIPVVLLTTAMLTTQFLQPPIYRSDLLSGIYFFLTLTWLGRTNFLANQRRWEENEAYEDQGASSVFLRTSLVLAIFITAFAWSTPTLINLATRGTKENKAFVQTLEDTGDFISNLFSPLESRPIRTERVFGDTLELGTAQPLSEDVLFTAIAPEKDLISGRYYWKARSYSTYIDGSWSSDGTEDRTIEENTPVLEGTAAELEKWEFIVVANSNMRYFYVPGTVHELDRAARITETFVDTDLQEVIALKPLLHLQENDTYRASVSFLDPNYELLDEARETYPFQIRRLYLQLPDDFSERITRLSEAITAGARTNFEKVLAITDYLRKEIMYSTEIGEAPNNLDPVFWVLFEEKKGFCNYYASAEVLMLRSLDIPARIAVGYAQGFEIEDGKVFEVRSKDSHAWVEVYFPEVGWVIFEPTAAQSPVRFPRLEELESVELTEEVVGADQQNGTAGLSPEGDPFSRFAAIEERLEAQEEQLYNIQIQEARNRWYIPLLWVVALSALIIFLIYGKVRVEGRRIPIQAAAVGLLQRKGRKVPHWLQRWAEFRTLSIAQRNFRAVDFQLRLLGYSTIDYWTPVEKANKLMGIIPAVEGALEKILEDFQTEVYGGKLVDEGVGKDSLRSIRWEGFKALIQQKFKQLKKRFSHN